MTKEELKKEAEKWLRKYLLCCNCEKKCNCIDSNSYCEEQVLKAYIDSAEPREKQIQIDAEQIRALQKQNGELTDKVKELEVRCNELFLQTCEQAEKVKELEAQIEKMKCCGNCQKLRGRFDSKTNINILYCSDSDMKQIEVGFQMCCCKWEIKEK